MTRLPDNDTLLIEPQEDGHHDETIEERCFSAALICLEGHYTQSPPMGPQTAAKVSSMINKTLEKTHTFRKAREAVSRNVAIWIWLTRIFAAAIPSLTTRSVGPLSSLNDPEKGVTPQESTALIVMNHVSIREDLETLIKLMHIARNLLVNAEPEVPQDICAAVHFDQMVYQTIILCVNVTSKGYDGEILDEAQRIKLGGVTELCQCPTNVNVCNAAGLTFTRQKATCDFVTTGT
jgi:palmitoyltransferase